MVKQPRLVEKPETKDWVTQRVEEAMAKLAEMEFDVPMDTPEGQRQYIELFIAPWLFAGHVWGYQTATGGDPENFRAIYGEAYAAVAGIFNEVAIDFWIVVAKVNYDRSIDCTMDVNGETFEWRNGRGSIYAYNFYRILVQTIGEDLTDQVQVLIANAEDLFYTGYQMMDNVYGYSEQ